MMMPLAVPALAGGALSWARATTNAGTDALSTPKTSMPKASPGRDCNQKKTTNAAAAAGKELNTITRRRPNLSDKAPKQNEPSMFARLSTPITQPVSSKVSALSLRSKVGVQAAELQKTDPPMNSAKARIKSGSEREALKDPPRTAELIERMFRI